MEFVISSTISSFFIFSDTSVLLSLFYKFDFENYIQAILT